MLRDILHEDFWDTSFEVVNEQDKPLPKGVIMQIKGPIGITEKQNRNGRVYTNSFWEDILNSPEIKGKLQERALVGAADHPKSFVPPISQVASVLTNAWVDKEKNALMGEIDVLDTPMGNVVKTCYDAKVKIGVSTRGAGQSTKKGDSQFVKSEGFKWGGADFCFEPSAQNAYPQPVMEQAEKILVESYKGTSNEDDKAYYKDILEKFGCNVQLLNEDANQINEENDNVESLKNKIVALETELAGTKADNGKLGSELNEAKEKLSAMLEYDTDKSKQVSTEEVSKLKEQVESLKAEKLELETKVASAPTEESLREKILKEGEVSANPIIEGLKKKNEALENEKKTYLGYRTTLESRISTLKEDLNKKDSRIVEIESSHKKLIMDKAELVCKVRNLEESDNVSRDDFNKLRVRYLAVKTGELTEAVQGMNLDSMTLEQAEKSIKERKAPRKNAIFEQSSIKIKEMVVENLDDSPEEDESKQTKGKVVNIINRMKGGKK